MPDACPTPLALKAFLDGQLTGGEAETVQLHLSQCLECAQRLDEITSTQLDGLGVGLLAEAHDFTSAKLAMVAVTPPGLMERAVPARHIETALLTALDAPGRPDSRGRFGPYEILGVIGCGGMAVVLKAHDPTLHRTVAIKVLAPARMWGEGDADRFLREARAIASLHHDHVVAIYTAGREKDFPYLVMPFHAEGTLDDWLKRTPRLPPREVARIGLQLARALAAAHGQGVLHCDVKPSNVLLEGGLDRVRLADFGLARPVHPTRFNLPKSIAGTPEYMSPEQARGDTTDARSDLFGLGALLFRLATGRTLHQGESTDLILRAAATFEQINVRTLNPSIPTALALIIDRLLSPLPERRYATATEAATALERFLDTAARRSRRLWRAGVGGAAVLLLMAGALLISDLSGRSAIINAVLCRQRGDGFYVRGRLGSYSRLQEAITAARPNEVIEVCFSGERPQGSFFVQQVPTTIRAAPGHAPILVATNNGDALIQATVPLTLEGLTLWRRSARVNFAPLISVENAPLNLLNCRLLRSGAQGQKILAWGKLAAVTASEPQQRAVPRGLVALQPGSSAHLRNCIVAGTMATIFAARGSIDNPPRVEIASSLLVCDSTFATHAVPGLGVHLQLADSVVVANVFLNLAVSDNPEPAIGPTMVLTNCFLDRSLGSVVRLRDDARQLTRNPLRWTQANVIYAGDGDWVIERDKITLASESEWKEWLSLEAGSYRVVSEGAFPKTCVRSALGVSATDLNEGVLSQINSGQGIFALQFVGDGSAYEKFRREPAHGVWRAEVEQRTREWLRRRNATAAVIQP